MEDHNIQLFSKCHARKWKTTISNCLASAMPGNRRQQINPWEIICSREKGKSMLHLVNREGKIWLPNRILIQWSHSVHSGFTLTGSLFSQLVSDAFDGLRPHHFIAKAQSSYTHATWRKTLLQMRLLCCWTLQTTTAAFHNPRCCIRTRLRQFTSHTSPICHILYSLFC